MEISLTDPLELTNIFMSLLEKKGGEYYVQ